MTSQPAQIIVDQQGNQLRKIDEIITGMPTPSRPNILGQKIADRIKTQPSKVNGLGETSARLFKS